MALSEKQIRKIDRAQLELREQGFGMPLVFRGKTEASLALAFTDAAYDLDKLPSENGIGYRADPDLDYVVIAAIDDRVRDNIRKNVTAMVDQLASRLKPSR